MCLNQKSKWLRAHHFRENKGPNILDLINFRGKTEAVFIAETIARKLIKRVEAKAAIANLLNKNSDDFAIDKYFSQLTFSYQESSIACDKGEVVSEKKYQLQHEWEDAEEIVNGKLLTLQYRQLLQSTPLHP